MHVKQNTKILKKSMEGDERERVSANYKTDTHTRKKKLLTALKYQKEIIRKTSSFSQTLNVLSVHYYIKFLTFDP